MNTLRSCMYGPEIINKVTSQQRLRSDDIPSTWNMECVCFIYFLLLEGSHSIFTAGHSLEASEVSAMVGDDVVLPCQVKPPENVAHLTVIWLRHDLYPEKILILRSGNLMTPNDNYNNSRVSMSRGELKKGNVSLQLSAVKDSDQGHYTCRVNERETQNRENKWIEGYVTLSVYSVSEPEVSVLRDKGLVVGLQCEARSLVPRPVVKWMYKDGSEIPHSHPEIVSGQDGLYNVTSKVTVDLTASNTYICSVASRGKEIQVPVADLSGLADENPDDGSNQTGTTSLKVVVVAVVVVVVVLLVALALGIYYLMKRRQTPTDDIPNQDREETEMNPFLNSIPPEHNE